MISKIMIFKIPIHAEGMYTKDIEVKLTKDNKLYYIRSRYDVDLVEELRAMKGSKWNPDISAWTMPICERNTYAINYLLGERIASNESNVINRVNITNFERPLFIHQKEGILFALHKYKCMLAFEMGLGKTLVTIEIMERAAFGSEGIKIWWLVAPYGAQQEWKRQLKKWNARVIPSLITTYESLYKYMDVIDEPPQGVIFDESIKIKNPNAQRSQISAELCRLVRLSHRKSFILLLSGAPAPKEPIDWWHQIECIFPGWIREGDIYKFRKRYANLRKVDHGYGQFYEIESWKEDEIAKLGKRLAPLVLVKKKKDCLDLPDKIFDIIYTPQEYKDKLKRITEIMILQSKTGIEALEKLRELSDGFQYRRKTVASENNSSSTGIDNSDVNSKNAVGHVNWIGSSKLDIIKQLLDFYHTENGGPGRLIIYAAFHASVDKLYKFVESNNWVSAKIDGRGWSDPNILQAFDGDRFENYCIIANSACVYGLSFAKTECLIYYSNSFSVDHRIQSLDRRDRPGMDTTKGTRIVDIINLKTDQLILDRLKQGISIQEITLQEIKQCLK